MECVVCGIDVSVPDRGWDSLLVHRGPQMSVVCGEECSNAISRAKRMPVLVRKRANDVAVESERCASDILLSNVSLRVRREHQRHVIECAFPIETGALLSSEVSSYVLDLIPESCTPRCLCVGGKIVAANRLGQGQVITRARVGARGRDSFLESIFGCESLGCQCRSDDQRLVRTLPCPLSPHCHSGRCAFSNKRSRWECDACESYWDRSQFSSNWASEERCRSQYSTTVKSLFADDGTFLPLNKSTFESLKRLLSSLSDAGLGPDHGLYTLTCELFVYYFLKLSGTMKGQSTQQASAQMAIRWVKLLLKSALIQITTWQYFGWFIGDVIAMVCEVSSHFPSLHSETVFLARFGIATGYETIYSGGNASYMTKLVETSEIGKTFASCESWISCYSDEPSDLQRDWEDFLMALTSRAVGSNQLKIEHLIGKSR